MSNKTPIRPIQPECDALGDAGCTLRGHSDLPVTAFGYEGTQMEQEAVEQEIRDLHTRIAELNRQIAVATEHRTYILSLQGRDTPPAA